MTTISSTSTPAVPVAQTVSASGITAVGQSRLNRKIIAPAIIVLIALGVVGGFYWRVHQTPRLTDKDQLILADFTNNTGDTVFDLTLKEALAIQLEQSPLIRRRGRDLCIQGRTRCPGFELLDCSRDSASSPGARPLRSHGSRRHTCACAMRGIRSALQEIERLASAEPANTLVNDIYLPQVKAAIALAQHRPQQVAALLTPAGAYILVSKAPQLLGRASLEMSNWQQAVSAFQPGLRYRGWSLQKAAAPARRLITHSASWEPPVPNRAWTKPPQPTATTSFWISGRTPISISPLRRKPSASSPPSVPHRFTDW